MKKTIIALAAAFLVPMFMLCPQVVSLQMRVATVIQGFFWRVTATNLT
jgi:hypothetical protein